MPLVVHFKRPAGWQATANIHYWDTSPADPATTWPGVAMTAEANDWYVYQFPTAEAASIVFNDGAGRQTGNLRRESAGWFYTNNTWYSLNPERPASRRTIMSAIISWTSWKLAIGTSNCRRSFE